MPPFRSQSFVPKRLVHWLTGFFSVTLKIRFSPRGSRRVSAVLSKQMKVVVQSVQLGFCRNHLDIYLEHPARVVPAPDTEKLLNEEVNPRQHFHATDHRLSTGGAPVEQFIVRIDIT